MALGGPDGANGLGLSYLPGPRASNLRKTTQTLSYKWAVWGYVNVLYGPSRLARRGLEGSPLHRPLHVPGFVGRGDPS